MNSGDDIVELFQGVDTYFWFDDVAIFYAVAIALSLALLAIRWFKRTPS